MKEVAGNVRESEAIRIARALKDHRKSLAKAAKALGISRLQLRMKMRIHGFTRAAR